MKTIAKLILTLNGNKSFFLHNGTESYYKKLRSAYIDVQNDQVNEYTYFSFFTLCASTLEYSLNFILADYCVNKFGPDNYKTYYEEYIGLKFKNKLLMIPHIVSGGIFMMNENCSSFKFLTELINLRNKILHNKEYLNEFDLPLDGIFENDTIAFDKEKEKIKFSFEVKDNYIDTLNKSKCLNYGHALGDFKKYIMLPAIENHVEENRMIIQTSY